MDNRTITTTKIGLRCAVALAVAAPAWLVARGAAAQSALEEIVVTATRRATNVQDVPLAITAITEETMRAQNIENLQDISSIVPNVLVRGGYDTNAVTVNMRGIPGVGIYVDGIWQVSGAGLLQKPFLDLERIEVLRGPQGTIYGRDSTGGSIHLYSKKPGKEFGGSVDMGIGDFERRDVTGSFDLPISENFRTRWTLAQYNHDGYIRSQVNGVKAGMLDDSVGRGDLYWEPTERFNARLSYQKDQLVSTAGKVIDLIYPDVAWQDGTQVGIAQLFDIASGGRFNQLSAASGAPGGSVGKWENRQKTHMPYRQNLEQTTFNVNYELSDHLTFKYLYGNTDVLDAIAVDYGGAEFNFFLDYTVTRTQVDSHEIQFAGEGDRLHWNAGVYKWDQTARQRGTDYAAADFVGTRDSGRTAVILNYNTVLASPACQATAASKGLDFSTRGAGPANGPNSWLTPCNGIFGRGILDALDFFLKGGDDGTQSGQNGRAFFGEVTVDFTKRWDMTFGVRHHQQDNYRYQVDMAAALAAGLAEKAPFTLGDEYASYAWALGGNLRATGPGSPLDPSATTSFDNTSYRFGTSYHIRDDLMVYFGYNEGFNSGGTSSFTNSAGGLVVNNYDPEIIKNTEFGLRGDFFGKRVRLNATVFDTDWLGVQINAQAIDPITGSVLTAVTTQNAANGNAKGADLEVLYSPTKNLTLGANLGFLDTGYTKVAGGLTEPYNLDTTFTGAPDKTYDLSVAYTWGLRNGGSLLTRVGYSYVGQYERSSLLSFREATIVPGKKEAGDFWKLNLRAVYKPSSAKYEISLFGNNLTNEYNLNSGFMHRFWNFDFATVDLPREVGLNFKVSF